MRERETKRSGKKREKEKGRGEEGTWAKQKSKTGRDINRGRMSHIG